MSRPYVEGRCGLEIGGPSAIFRRGHLLPLYPLAASIDNCNFAPTTVWEGDIAEGRTFSFDRGRPPGLQFIREAIDLRGIPDGRYEFVLSSHTIEHIANPLRALKEWMRVLAPRGALVLVAPHRENHLDRHREVTTLEHLRNDFAADVRDDDPTNRDRTRHHHVFSTRSIAEAVRGEGMHLRAVEALRPHHIVILATKTGPGDSSVVEDALARSPFGSDRHRG